MGKSYVDEVVCDIVEMDACHLILGRPWQYDVDATHRCKDNVYVFFKNGRKIVLGPIKVVYPKALKWRESHHFSSTKLWVAPVSSIALAPFPIISTCTKDSPLELPPALRAFSNCKRFTLLGTSSSDRPLSSLATIALGFSRLRKSLAQ